MEPQGKSGTLTGAPLMINLDHVFYDSGQELNKGLSTKCRQAALRKLGPGT